jgi:phosphoglycerol transferase MdoB-like AlkP superfamily enzyme
MRSIFKAFTRLQRFRILAVIVLVYLLGFLLTRLGLLFWFVDWRQLRLSEWVKVFQAGMRFDLLIALLGVQIQLWHFTWGHNRWLKSRASRWFIESCWLVAFCFIPLFAIIESLFFTEFDGRLNYIAFEYLVYPTEVCCNIWQSFPVIELTSFVALIGGGLWWGMRQRFGRMLENQMPLRHRVGVFAGVWTLIGGLWLTSGMSSMNVTTNRTANECAGNGVYSFLSHAWSCHFDYEQFYLTIKPEIAAAEIRQRVITAADEWHVDSRNPLDRTVRQAQPQRDWNVVIVLEESLGSDYIGALGDDRGLTPCLDKLATQGLLFDNFFATGNRTARALEAVTTSLPPIPTESILKRDHSRHVYTLAHVLAERGYNRLFMTAGRGLFDGVKSFMTANGFNRFFEQKDFVNPVFVNAWGVSDEDLFNGALMELDKLHDEGKPFLACLLTVSNHRPFTYPDGRIDRLSAEQTRDNAVKYADWSIGMFFDKVGEHAWKKNTLFVVMGDHGARVYGSQLFPMKSYRVPVLMLGPEDLGKGTRCSTLACTLDIAPTVMGLLGGDYRSTFFGRDALHLPPEQGYALMQHNHDVALLTADNRLMVLDARRQAWVYTLDPKTFALQPESLPPKERVQATAAFFQTAYRLYYDERLFPALDSASNANAPKSESSNIVPASYVTPAKRP